jgi:hypothetical protein
MALYSANARELGMIWAETCARRLGRLAADRRRTLMARFCVADALSWTALEVSAVRRPAVAAFVFVSWSSSLARLAPLGADMYTTASMRSMPTWARNAPVGLPVVLFTVLALERLTASLAVMLTANA